ncbi:hypothetical protein BS636_12330 [Acinetobacter sp. LoGeW2-3]|uniref:hypothetical protein n=1 Tax=Acinetobacter sp. LoGeW2-3 TaxID=1808001 RepID=UPI000C05C722|nr:hypothetical protein [Acinetobacter sp. LoGeW2-3]ATO20395.1 hypothetical protein BS636_12330 [Acinetobacter sp. LoGeW2-3]
MLKGFAIVLAVDARHKDIIQFLITQHSIFVDPKGIISEHVPNYYLKRDISRLIHFYSKTENLNILLNADPLTNHIKINEVLCQFIEKFKNLSLMKSYFLESSYLLLIYEDKIDQNNLIEFTPKTLSLLSDVGLGISYNIVHSN